MVPLNKLVISWDTDLRAAMTQIQASSQGIVFVTNHKNEVFGSLTDGDIRKALLGTGNLDSPVTNHMNRNFISVRQGTPKEQTLKLLDQRIKVVPILNLQGEIVDIVRRGYTTVPNETFARARAPVRISLAGGGTDFTNYFTKHGGTSLSTTLAKYAHAELRRRSDGRVKIDSYDTGETVEAESIEALAYDGTLDIIKAGVKVMAPEYGFDLRLGCDFPPGSGLGGSAALLASIIGCFNEFRQHKLDSYDIAEHAFEAERVELNIAGGWQDQYSTVFGGFNHIEFDNWRNTVIPLRLPLDTLSELEERFIICYTGQSHLGNTIQKENRARRMDNHESSELAAGLKEIALSMKANLLRGNLADFGSMFNETWRLKKKWGQKVTNQHLDRIYDTAIASGAAGGRLLGTGGGGYFLFYVKPFHRYEVSRALAELELSAESVIFDVHGLKSWTARV